MKDRGGMGRTVQSNVRQSKIGLDRAGRRRAVLGKAGQSRAVLGKAG